MGRKPGLPAGPIQPFHLACACYMYESMTDYARSLDRFRQKVGASLDLSQEDQRRALLKFLNDWGCRNLAKKWHGLASDVLAGWYADAKVKLRLFDGSLAELDEAHLNDLVDVFDSLSTQIASKPTKKSGQVDVSFGPTATSKTLFALNPHILPAWDGRIRKKSGCDGSGTSYSEFAKHIHRKIRETEKSFATQGFNLAELPTKLGRPEGYTTVAQLMIEYYWITMTRGVQLPSATRAQEWLPRSREAD